MTIEDCVFNLWEETQNTYAYILRCAANSKLYIIQLDSAPYGCSAYQIMNNDTNAFTLGEDTFAFALENKDKTIWKCIGIFSFD